MATNWNLRGTLLALLLTLAGMLPTGGCTPTYDATPLSESPTAEELKECDQKCWVTGDNCQVRWTWHGGSAPKPGDTGQLISGQVECVKPGACDATCPYPFGNGVDGISGQPNVGALCAGKVILIGWTARPAQPFCLSKDWDKGTSTPDGGAGGDTTPPMVTVSAPTAGATVTGASVTVSANATDNSGTVASVQFFDGATLIGTDTTAPFAVTWDSTKVANGAHVLTAKATDATGNAATSTGVSVTVANVPPGPPACPVWAEGAITWTPIPGSPLDSPPVTGPCAAEWRGQGPPDGPCAAQGADGKNYYFPSACLSQVCKNNGRCL